MQDIPVCLIELAADDTIIDANKLFEVELNKIDVKKQDFVGNDIKKYIKKFSKIMLRNTECILIGNRAIHCIISVKDMIIFIEVINYNISFIKYINQEFKKPIMKSIELVNIISNTNLNKEQKRFTELMKENNYQLTKTINDTIDYLKLLSNNVVLNKKRFKISAAIEQVEKLIKSPVDINLIFDYKELEVFTDYDRFVELLIHVINHCLNHTKKGFINIKSKNNEDIIVMYITDTGQKLSKITQELMFHGFANIAQDAIEKRNYAGSLELSIAKYLAKLMNGDVILERTEEYGSSYKYYLDIIDEY